jgi:putative transposase
MLVTRAYRHKARFTPEQEMLARRFAGCTRLIYNAGLEQRKLGYAVTGQRMSYMRQTYFLKEVKADPRFAFLSQAPAHVLQQALRDLDRAYQNFFAGRARYPKPRRRGERDGFRFPDAKQIDSNDPARQGQVRLPKLGWVSVRNCYPRLGGRLFEGALKHVSVVREADGWYVSFCCEVQLTDPLAPAGPALGLDVGISNSLATSDGQFVHVAVINDAEWAKIGRLQSQVNRRRKGSHNREKARLALARYRRRLAARKLDAIHKLTTELARRHELLAIEDLRVANMTRSAKGTLEQPGSNVAQKAGLNRAILEECWGELRRQLDYKTCWYGSALVAVNPSRSRTWRRA